MPDTLQPDQRSFTLDDALAWLAQPASADPLADLVELRRALLALSNAEAPPAHRLRIVEIFGPRLQSMHQAATALLLEFPQPLPKPLGDVTQGIMESHGLISNILLDAALELGASVPPPVRRPIERIGTAVMQALQGKLELSLLAFGQVPEEIWSNAWAALHLPHADASTADYAIFGQMLALSAAQPESFTPRELHYLRTVLQLFAEPADILETTPRDDSPYFWLDIDQDSPPVASTRRLPPLSSNLLHFRFETLINALNPITEQLSSGTPATALGMPMESNQADYLNVLRRVRQSLAEPPRRQFPRRRQSHAVNVCTRLSEFWGLLSRADEVSEELSDWTVINKSPDGCALELETGNVSGLVAGAALGMRESGDSAWSVCLIRWIRGGLAEQIELGLEFMAPEAYPVRIVYGEAAHESLPGLLLPALPKLKRPETLLVGRGRREGREFNLIMEDPSGKISLASCRPAKVVQQTSSIEIFEFERLRTPS